MAAAGDPGGRGILPEELNKRTGLLNRYKIYFAFLTFETSFEIIKRIKEPITSRLCRESRKYHFKEDDTNVNKSVLPHF